MTENVRQEILKDIKDGYIDAWDNLVIDELFEQIEREHEEIQQHRAIGTIEELQELKSKSVTKKPIKRTRFNLTVFSCPTCNAGLYSYQRFCDECGQSILNDYD